MLYHKSHLYDLPSVSQITHVQSPMSAFKSEHSIFSPEIIIGPGDSCSNTHPQPFSPNLPAEQGWQRRGGSNAAAGGARGCKARTRCLPHKTTASRAHGGGRTWRGKHTPTGIGHSTQPSPRAQSRQGQPEPAAAAEGRWGQCCPQPGVSRWPPGVFNRDERRVLRASLAPSLLAQPCPGQGGRLQLSTGHSSHASCAARTRHRTPA